jgi:hypothetical protein
MCHRRLGHLDVRNIFPQLIENVLVRPLEVIVRHFKGVCFLLIFVHFHLCVRMGVEVLSYIHTPHMQRSEKLPVLVDQQILSLPVFDGWLYGWLNFSTARMK